MYLTEVPAASVAITHVTPHTHYLGSYPTARLVDGEHGGFTVNVTAHLWVPPGGATGSLSVAGSWTDDLIESSGNSDDTLQYGVVSSGPVTLPAGESAVSLVLTASAAQIKLWWPSGLGEQNRYSVRATWTPVSVVGSPADSSMPGNVTAVRQLGFRAFALVTINDTDAATVTANATSEGTGTHGMFFRVNGAALYSRGANMVRRTHSLCDSVSLSLSLSLSLSRSLSLALSSLALSKVYAFWHQGADGGA